jgi:hypothetical protein
MDTMIILPLVAFLMAAIGLIIATVALVKISQMRRRLVALDAWRKEAEDSGDSAYKQLEGLKAEFESLGHTTGAIQALQNKVSLLERTSPPGTSSSTPSYPGTSQVPRPTLQTPVFYDQVMPAVSSGPSSQERRLRDLLDAFNVTAREPTHPAVERFANNFKAQAGPGQMWRVELPDGHSAIVPGKEMIMNWAADYRGSAAQSIRNEHLEKWYQMADGTDLVLERIALELTGGVIQRGALRGI